MYDTVCGTPSQEAAHSKGWAPGLGLTAATAWWGAERGKFISRAAQQLHQLGSALAKTGSP